MAAHGPFRLTTAGAPVTARSFGKGRAPETARAFAARHGEGDSGRRLVHHASKALGHALTLRGTKAVEDLAGFAGTLGWMMRRG